VAILSRFPLRDPELIPLKRYDLGFKSRCRVALAATVESPLGPVRVVNVHLDSRMNRSERLAQLRPVVERLASFSGPQLIGGDFNTADVFWLGRTIPLPFAQKQSFAVREFMASQGFASPFESTGRTFSYLPLRLDWIFVKGMEPVAVGVEAMPFSDHRGLWLRLDAGGGG
jgi:endonuclease/exonuclease/phosphatase family metal-dependent hydrolase